MSEKIHKSTFEVKISVLYKYIVARYCLVYVMYDHLPTTILKEKYEAPKM